LKKGKFKELFKQALFEVLQEREEWFHNLFTEVMEDFTLAKAIREGEAGESVSREEVFSILEGEA